MLQNPGKNLLMMLIALIAVCAMFLLTPGGAFPGPCPTVPDGCFSPGFVVQSHWDAWHVDMQNGLIIVVAKNKQPGAVVTHAMGIYVVGSEWPSLFNYVENSVIQFLRYDGKVECYVRDETVDEENYDIVVKLYKTLLNVDLSSRRKV